MNNKLEDYPVGKEPEEVLGWLYRFNRDSEFGVPMPTSIARKAIQDIQDTRLQRDLFVMLFILAMIGITILTVLLVKQE